MSVLAVLKIVAIPCLLWLVWSVSKRFGPLVGGVMNGLPLISGPISLVVALEQGPRFATDAAWGAYPGMTCLVVFGLCYAHFGKRLPWLPAVVCTFVVYAACTLVPSLVPLPDALWPAIAFVALIVGINTLPKPDPKGGVMPVSSGKRPYLQMACGAVLMVCITTLARLVGPTYSGLFMFFPVIGGILGFFFLKARCVNAVIFLFKGTYWGAFTGWSFMMTLIWMLPHYSIAVSYLAAAGSALAVSGLLVLRAKR